MVRTTLRVVMVVVALVWVAGFFVTRAATVEGRHIARYDVTVDLEADGVAHVTIDMDYDFGAEAGHGPFVTLPTRQGFDEDHDRRYRVSDVRASSRTGAPARTYIDHRGGEVQVRVGQEGRDDIRGLHQYTIGYRLEGMVNPQHLTGDLDEFHWNAVGAAWEIPLSDVMVTVRGPDGIVDVACFAGEMGSTDACASASSSESVATFTEPHLEPGQPLTVVVGWPGETFERARALLVPRLRPFASVDPLTPAGGVAGLVVLVGLGGATLLARWRGRDRVYAAVTPGLAPADDGASRTARRGKAPVAVQFEPPQGVRPGLVGTVLDGSADPEDVTGTIVDLAVRGYLRIEEVEEDERWGTAEREWRIVRLREPGGELEPFEATIMGGLFTHDASAVRLDSLRGTFASAMRRVQRELDKEVVARGWYRASPGRTRATWRAVGFFVSVLGLFSTFALFSVPPPPGSLLVCLAIAVVGVGILRNGKHAAARTAEGSAVLAQTLGFQHFIATAEANQLRWEEGEDIFSRYLPYAIVFGETERWTRVFAELAAEGRVPESASWYVGGAEATSGALAVGTASLGVALASFTAVASSAFDPPRTSGSSGGSGFSGGGSSGGGGSAGGGGGGGGGGGW